MTTRLEYDEVCALGVFALKLTDYMLDAYRHELHGFGRDIRVQNQKRSYHRYLRQRRVHMIVYGYESIVRWAETGVYEYASYRHIVPSPVPVGVEAIWWLVCHETAHALQCARGGRFFGDVHNEHHIQAYAELRERFPLASVLHLLPPEAMCLYVGTGGIAPETDDPFVEMEFFDAMFS